MNRILRSQNPELATRHPSARYILGYKRFFDVSQYVHTTKKLKEMGCQTGVIILPTHTIHYSIRESLKMTIYALFDPPKMGGIS